MSQTAIGAPQAEASEDAVPFAERFGQITQWRTGWRDS
jgi:hypothetical protein